MEIPSRPDQDPQKSTHSLDDAPESSPADKPHEDAPPRRGLPSPDEIQKEFQEMVQKKFGGMVQVVSLDTSALPQNEKQMESTEVPPTKYNFEFDYTPKQIVDELDGTIIGQIGRASCRERVCLAV